MKRFLLALLFAIIPRYCSFVPFRPSTLPKFLYPCYEQKVCPSVSNSLMPSHARTTSLHMFHRFWTIIKANINSLLRRWEDPEKLLDQAIEDMNGDVLQVRNSLAQIAASKIRTSRQIETTAAACTSWNKNAIQAMRQGDETAAREALRQKQSLEDLLENLRRQFAVQEEGCNKMKAALHTLEAKVVEARLQKEQFVARARTAKSTKHVHEMLASVNGVGDNAIGVFERMKQRVEELEIASDVAKEYAQLADVRVDRPTKNLQNTEERLNKEFDELKSIFDGSSNISSDSRGTIVIKQVKIK